MSKLINQGGFGCIYYPGINCNGKPLINKKYATKLQQDNFAAHNEYEIGMIIKKIPLFSYNFVPIMQMCNINLAEISKREIEQCKAVENKTDKKFVVMKMNYIDKMDFYNFLTNKSENKKQIISSLFDSYIFLLNNLETLEKNKIVHFDLKMQNIIINKITKTPLIIDFGLSIPIDRLNINNYSNYFYIYKVSYYIWPLEVHVINYLIHIENSLTHDNLLSITTEYVKNNSGLQLFSPIFKQKFIDLAFKSFEKYIGKSKEIIIKDLIKYWNTWDNYSLSILYLILINFISSYGFIGNKLITSFSNLLLYNIHPNPERRKKIKDTKKIFNELFYLSDNIESYEKLIENFNINLFAENTLKESKKID